MTNEQKMLTSLASVLAVGLTLWGAAFAWVLGL
jgi:hypothetical protein